MPDAGVQDGGDVMGSGQIPFSDRVGQDSGGIEAGQFGAAQGAPQPLRLVAGRPAVAGRQDGHQPGAVGLVPDGGGLGGPDRVQDGQVVGVGQGLAAGLGGGVLLAVAVQHAAQHSERVRRGGWARERPGCWGRARLVVAGEFGGRARARGRVGGLG